MHGVVYSRRGRGGIPGGTKGELALTAPTIRVAIITVSDGVAAGRREDRGGPACEAALREAGLPVEIRAREVVPDDPQAVAAAARRLGDSGSADLLVFTGGTGVSPRDRTPEALRPLMDLEIPGFPEKMRSETGRDFPAAYLSRQIAGIRGRCLLIAVPGSPTGAGDCLRAVASLIPHAVALAQGAPSEHPRPA
ncbi:MAG TPA: MogA/MoaB family molybdenum cofactor biosynthesis protein [Thermoanaerobaculia bacterium]